MDAPARSKEHRAPQWPWWVTCAAGAIAVLLAAWLLIAGAAVVASLASPETELVASLTFASKMVILAHGAPVVVAGQPISIMPLTLTFALILLGIPVTSMAARQLAANQSEPDDTGQLWLDGQSLVVRITLTFAIPYALTVSLASAQASGRHAWSALVGSFVVAVIAGLWGASHAIGHDPRLEWPAWLRSVPSALASGVLICLAGGAAAITAALILNREQVVAIHEALGPGPVGSVLLLLLQLLFLPNLALWGTSWTLGAGVTLGDGSLMNLNVSDSGFLPAIPIFGITPDQGLTPTSAMWWLLFGVVAGAVSAGLVVWARPRARFDQTALVGALTGIVTGVLIALLCSLAGGGLGAARLDHLGPVTAQVLVVSSSILGLAGLLTGLVIGLVRRPELDEPEG